MYETEDELASLQALIERSMAAASPQLRSTAPEGRRLSAAQLVDVLRGKAQMAVGTVSASGEPRVSPLDVLLMHGRFYFCTSARAAKVGHLRRRPAVSLAYVDSDVVGVTVHGTATLHEWGAPRFAELDREFLAVYGGTPSTEDEAVVFIEVEPARLYTYDRRAERAGPTYVIAGTKPGRSAVAAALAAQVRSGAQSVLETDAAAGELGPLRTSIERRPCHVVVVAADPAAYAAGAARVGIWLDPADGSPDELAATILARTDSEREPIVIAAYDPDWPALFERLAAPLRAALADLGAIVEHVGSTAVPGLAAKPIVDIDVVVSGAAEVPGAIERLRRLGYVYQGDKGIPGREAFLWPPEAPRHHLYVVVAGNAVHRAHLRFRDLLRDRPDLAGEYAELKRSLVPRHARDANGYTAAKTGFIDRALADRA